MVGRISEDRTILVSKRADRARRRLFVLAAAVLVVIPIACASAGGSKEPPPAAPPGTPPKTAEAGSTTLESGDMTITCAVPAKGPQLYVERAADKAGLKDPTNEVRYFTTFGNFLAYRYDEGTKEQTYVGTFDPAELTITISYTAHLKEVLHGLPIEKVKFLFWDDKTASWYAVTAGSSSDPKVSQFHFVFDPVAKDATTLTIHVLRWPSEDACVGCGG